MKQFFYILLLSFTSLLSQAKVMSVGHKQGFATIKQALANANNGDTIYVHSGIYKEGNIVIKHSISLLGIGWPIIDGESKYEVISVKASNVCISGCKIQHSGVSSLEDLAGIKIYNQSNVLIKNNQLYDTFFGIYTQYGSNCSIFQNQLIGIATDEQQSGNGIHCWKSDGMQIKGNTVSGHRDGIYFEFVTNSQIANNLSDKNLRYGLHFMFSNNDVYFLNKFKNNGAGVAVMFSHGVKMIQNVFEQNWGDAAYGLLLKEIGDGYIKGNVFNQNTCGIYMEGASRILMMNNKFTSNGWAIKMQASCMDIDVQSNNFINNTFDVGTNGSLVLNTFNNNYWDKYEGYDLNKNQIGDVPYRPVSMYSMIIEKNPPAMMLFRSFITALIDKIEKVLPTLTPENLVDNRPLMKPLKL